MWYGVHVQGTNYIISSPLTGYCCPRKAIKVLRNMLFLKLSKQTTVFILGCYCYPIDIDECEVSTELCTGNHTHCTNTLGSFTCGCDAGFQMEDGDCRSKKQIHLHIVMMHSLGRNLLVSRECMCKSLVR